MKKIFLLLAITFSLLTPSRPLAAAEDGNSGKRMYLKYCSSCHGADGKGAGEVSGFLKIKLPDLTQLSKNNRGIYPMDDVMAAIDGRRAVRGHGDRNMPVWGEVFGKEFEECRYPELTTLLKAKIIADYIARLQN